MVRSGLLVTSLFFAPTVIIGGIGVVVVAVVVVRSARGR